MPNLTIDQSVARLLPPATLPSLLDDPNEVHMAMMMMFVASLRRLQSQGLPVALWGDVLLEIGNTWLYAHELPFTPENAKAFESAAHYAMATLFVTHHHKTCPPKEVQ